MLATKHTLTEVSMTRSNSTTKQNIYTHISYAERCQIKGFLKIGLSINKIAKILKRSKSTISIEIKRGTVEQMDSLRGIYTVYSPDAAEYKYNVNRLKSGKKIKFMKVQKFLRFAEKKILDESWSPDAVVGHVLANKIFTKSEMVSTKTLYKYIDKKLLTVRNIHLCDKVKLKAKTVKNRIHKRIFGKSIDLRDPSIIDRLKFGHWEIDLVILGKSSSEALLTLVERKTRYTIVRLVNNRTSAEICRVLATILCEYIAPIFKTITADNGSEFSRLTEIFEETYYAHPYSSFERGTNERHNGLIRRFIPKGTLFKDIDIGIIEKTANWCNTLPRKILNYSTTEKEFKNEIKKLA